MAATFDWYHGLNPEQQEAVAHNQGPLLILAGAGSGKTTVLVSRAGRLIDEKKVASQNLCVLTFTNKAARELKSRVAVRLGKRAEGIVAGTFHAFGRQILRKFYKEAGLTKQFGVIDAKDAGAQIKDLLRSLNNAGKTAYDVDRLLSRISHWREMGYKQARSVDEYDEAVEWILPKYLERLQQLGVVDFDGLLLLPLTLMQKNKVVCEKIQKSFTHVMVDEFQDTNTLQMKLIKLLVAPHKNVAVVGDDDQAIYGWRGACVKNILEFPKLYSQCKVVRLERNYRSTKPILDVANEIIKKNTQRHGKRLVAAAQSESEAPLPDSLVFDSEDDEIEGVIGELRRFHREGFAYGETAVLYRSNSQGALLEAHLRQQNFPYQISGGTAFFDRKETRDVLAYLRASIYKSELALRRILNTPARGIGNHSIEKITQQSQHQGISFYRSAKKWSLASVDPKCGQAIDAFLSQLLALPNQLSSVATPGTQLFHWLDQMGYRQHLLKHVPDAVKAAQRWKFVQVFCEILDKFAVRGGNNVVKDFLDAMELRDTEEDEDPKDTIHLLTLHACKGLEFPAVVLMGVEEDLLPHKTLGSDIAEERRLFYVGVTRAQKRLSFTRSRRRKRQGKEVPCVPSRFLLEIPRQLIRHHDGPRAIEENHRKSLVADLFKRLDALDAQ